MSEDYSYSGYMPMVKQITMSQKIQMLDTDGNIIHGHAFTVKTREEKDFVFSITTEDLMRMYFLVLKALGNVS